MIFEVRISALVMTKATEQFGDVRSPQGSPDAYDFVNGPLAAATFAFRDFGALSYDVVAAVRSYLIPDPVPRPDTGPGAAHATTSFRSRHGPV